MINVLIVDDSAFMRQFFKKIIDKQPKMKTIAVARNGKDAIKKIKKYSPDVVTMDIEMPELDGLETLKRLKEKNLFNIPILMVSALDDRANVMDALDLGAFDFLPKPSHRISMDIEEISDDLINKVEAAYNSNKNRSDEVHKPHVVNKRINRNIDKYPIVAVGASSGGPNALKELLTSFPEDFQGGLIVVQHMPEGFTKTLADRLDSLSEIEISEAKNGDRIQKGKALIAPGNYHLEINNGKVELNQNPKKWGVRPCVDFTMSSVAKEYKDRVIGVVLTGMGHDAGLGMRDIKENGGYCIVQDKKSALVYGMPQSAIDNNACHEIVPLSEIATKIMDTIERKF